VVHKKELLFSEAIITHVLAILFNYAEDSTVVASFSA
jgi:hypothetical protein